MLRRRALLMAALVVLLASSVPAGDRESRRWLPLGSSAPGGQVSTALSLRAAGRVEARVTVPGMWAEQVATPAGGRAAIAIPGAGWTADIGRPRLPVMRYLVEVPAGARAAAILEPSGTETWTLEAIGIRRPVIPVQPPVPKIAGAEDGIPFTEDAASYAAEADYPSERVIIAGEAVLRGRHVVLVEARPVRYNPARGTLDVWREAVLRVTWSGGDDAASAREISRLRSKSLDSWIGSEILNASSPSVSGPGGVSADTAGGAAEGAEGLLVIAYDGFVDAVQPLVEWKRKSGYKVELIRTSSLGSPPTDAAVKNAIQTRYDTWSNPSLGFLLIVGDTDFAPIHNGNGGGSSQVTDNWYVCLDGTDYLPDAAIARISTRTSAETQDVVDKLMPYEKATFATSAWIKKSGFIGTGDGSYYGMVEATHDFCIDTYMIPNGYQPTAWSHGKQASDRHYYSVDADTSEISASVDDGRSIVNYSGHGATTYWAGPTSHGEYNQANINANTNDGMYPFVISNACITGSLAVSECFGETWQKAPHKGAIAFWGASNNSYWDEDDYLQRQLYTHIYPMDSTPALGILVNQAKIDLYNHYGSTGTVAYYFDMYNLLAEPTLSVWTREPRTMTVSHPSSIPIGQNTIDVTVTDAGSAVPGALVAVRRTEGGVFESGYTGANGQVTLTLDPAPATVGPMEVTVTKHDFRPYEGTCDVISPDTPWLAYRSHQIDDSAGGDGDGRANPGETIVMPVTVENVGGMSGTGLAGTLGTNTPDFVEIVDAQASFPDLAVHALGTTLPDHFRFRVRPAAPDAALLGFDLHWTASDGSSGTTSFTEPVTAVDFAYGHHSIDDSAGGNGNGAAGPGETVDMTVNVANAGHKDATTLKGVLGTSSPYVTILRAEADFPDIPTGGNADSLPPAFRFSVANNAPDKQPVTFTLSMTEQGSGHGEVLTFDVMISSCSVTVATDVPKDIFDNSMVESVLDLPNAISIGELNVFVDIKHTYIGDLKVTAISPLGTTVLLHDNSGGSTDNLYTWYDTETQPAEPLSRFNGEDSQGTWRLRVQDTASGDTGRLDGWKLEVCGQAAAPHPVLSVVSHGMSDAGACDPDGFADVGETVHFLVTVRNAGSAPATNIRAALSSSSRVASLDGPVEIPDLAPGQSADADFRVEIGAVSCMESAQFSVVLSADQGSWGGGFTQTLETDPAGEESAETVEHAGAEPQGWSHSALEGTDDWRVVSTKNHSSGGTWSWFASDPNKVKDDVLVTPSYTLLPSGTSTLEFSHWADLQDGFDGAVVEISADGGSTWTDLGSHFTSGGYDKSLSGLGPLSGRQAFTGTYTAWKTTTADLSAWAGETVRFRFRLGCDGATKKVGWWVDDVVVRTQGLACDGHACGVPGEVRITSVSREGTNVVLSWWADPLALDYRVLRAGDPSRAENFQDVTVEDPDATDGEFRDGSTLPFAAFIVTAIGPDGEGPWGHFGR